ncbi:MAG: DNA polymerase III subunit epsilon [Holosporales bacterium]|jgi:DNA polymerase-3 subunit epsilon|nr:DNA polymerase III subunit epsilon [Holosporales bacterium]
MFRKIVLDTETTGLKETDRIIEIGCVELIDDIPSERIFHEYVNPECEVPDEVVRITGLTYDFLKDYPTFAFYADSFLEFIADDILVIHNAKFDVGMLNTELQRFGKQPISLIRTIDTVQLARKKFPGSPASLDALAKRYNIARERHGALIDAKVLAKVYVKLIESSYQQILDIYENNTNVANDSKNVAFPRRFFLPNSVELEAFNKMLSSMQPTSMWEELDRNDGI